MNSKALQLMGIARRASALAMGHDMALESVKSSKSCLIVLASDASQRLEGEFSRAISFKQLSVQLLRSAHTTSEFHHALGYKAAVVSVINSGFAERLAQLLKEETL